MSSSSTSHGYFESVSTQLSLSVGSSFEDVAGNSAANASQGVSAGVSAVDTGMNGKVIEERSMLYTSYKDYVRIPFLFQGQYYDGEVKLAYNRFRYYDPQMGRYISEDPIRFESGQINLFTYVKDTNVWIDMLGLAQANGGNAPKYGNTGHNKAIDEHIQKLRSNPQVSEIRKNQQLVNYEGNVVGKNRPDIQYNRGGIHYTVEYDTKVSSSIKHQRQSPMLAPDARHTYWHIQSDGSKISGLSIREKNSTYIKK